MNVRKLIINKTSVETKELVRMSMGVTGASVKKDTPIMAMKGRHAQSLTVEASVKTAGSQSRSEAWQTFCP